MTRRILACIVILMPTFVFIILQEALWYAWPITNYSKSAATYGIDVLDDEVDWSQHPCKRECKDGEPPMTCRYGFTIENYATMSRACYNCSSNVTDCYRPHCLPADGDLRVVRVVNRQLPGPSIEVCKNDRIIVDVVNMLDGESTTIHWHGLHQRGTPFMDGVPMVSQCPIVAGDSFRYEFFADTAGTHWWHSHSGVQRADGLFGGLIVRSQPSLNLVGHLYDHDEHLIILNEWGKRSISETYPLRHHTGINLMNVHSILINGLGRYEAHNKSTLIPRPVFRVRMGTKNRFRVISAASYECTLRITVDRHPLLVISTDGGDVKPVEVDAIRLIPGERYDFVLDANLQVDNYWIRVSGGSNNCKLKHQEAILRYEGAPDSDPVGPVGFDIGFEPGKKLLNPENQGSESNGAMCISCSLTSLESDGVDLTATPDHQFYLNMDVYFLNNLKDYRKNLYDTSQISLTSATMQLNRLSFKAPDFPLQTQPELIKADQLCNVTEAKCTREQCSCPHVHQIKLNSTVEIVFVSDAIYKSANNLRPPHSMHLHGFYYRVVAMERLNETTSIETVRAWDRAGKIHRKLKGAPLKDVLDMPSGGYVVVRFQADNPGYWFMHCHFETHSHNGMAMVLKVGEHEDFPPVPKNFPKCHYRASVGNSGVALPLIATALQLFYVLLVFIVSN